ncbi:hypothetical protein ACFYTQ_10650 [Nocardia sp. NPDC004068]|uniref:hypothetical protein n=1 Tax=Nocardia sp. NPDC004068 TaxID=3364303 RepID=UPI0036B87F5C
MSSGFDKRPEDEDAAVTRAIRRVQSPADTAKTEMFAQPEPPLPRPNWQDWAAREPADHTEVMPRGGNRPAPAPPRESRPGLDHDAATRALQSLAGATGRSATPPEDPTRPITEVPPAQDAAAPPRRPQNPPPAQRFPAGPPQDPARRTPPAGPTDPRYPEPSASETTRRISPAAQGNPRYPETNVSANPATGSEPTRRTPPAARRDSQYPDTTVGANPAQANSRYPETTVSANPTTGAEPPRRTPAAGRPDSRYPETTVSANPAGGSAKPRRTSAAAQGDSRYPETMVGVPAAGGSDEPPTGRGRKGWLLAGAAVVVVAAVAGAVALVSTRHHTDAPATDAAPSPSMVSALTTGRAAAPSTTRPSTTRPTTTAAAAAAVAAEPVIPGYQTVLIPDRGAVYDVPADWKIDPLATTTLGNPPDTVEIAGRTTDGENYCPRSVRTSAFLTLSGQSDPAAAAKEVGMRMIKVGWPAATGANSNAAEPLTSLDGQLHGAFVETTGGGATPAPGCAKAFSVFTFAFPGENSNFVMTIAADQGVAKSVDKETAKRILASIRPLPVR